MYLAEAARRMSISPARLRRIVADYHLPKAKRKIPSHLHEHYLARHFVKDTKGNRRATRGRFPWLIDDRHLHLFEIQRDRLLNAPPESRHRASDDVLKRLAEFL